MRGLVQGSPALGLSLAVLSIFTQQCELSLHPFLPFALNFQAFHMVSFKTDTHRYLYSQDQ